MPPVKIEGYPSYPEKWYGNYEVYKWHNLYFILLQTSEINIIINIMKRKNSPAEMQINKTFKVIFYIIFIINIILLLGILFVYYLLLNAKGPGAIGLIGFGFIYNSIRSYILYLAIVDLAIILFFIINNYNVLKIKALKYLIFLPIPIFYIYIYNPLIVAYIPFYPAAIPREKMINYINDCNVVELHNMNNEHLSIFVEFDTDDEVGVHDQNNKQYIMVKNGDFDAYLNAASQVKERCGYETEYIPYGNFIGFKRVFHPVFVSIERLDEVLSSCNIKEAAYPIRNSYYYTELESESPEDHKGIVGKPTGIIVNYKERPQWIYIKEELKSITFSTVKEAMNKCPNLKLWN